MPLDKFYNMIVINQDLRGQAGRTLGLAMAIAEQGVELTPL